MHSGIVLLTFRRCHQHLDHAKEKESIKGKQHNSKHKQLLANRPCLVGRKKKFLHTNVGKCFKKALAHVAACNALNFFSLESLAVKLQFTIQSFFVFFFSEQAFFDIRFSYKHCNFPKDLDYQTSSEANKKKAMLLQSFMKNLASTSVSVDTLNTPGIRGLAQARME